MSNILDVTREIRLDHDNVRDLFDRYKQSTDDSQKVILANTLVREMAVHGEAEEISVYNQYSKLGLGATVAHNKEEHAEIKKLLYEADSTSFSNPEYDQKLSRAATAFIAHAQEEEDEQLMMIRAKVSAQESDDLARAFLRARKAAPTRPHPAAPQTGGIAQKAAGLQAGIHDKIVETVGGRDFASLKYTHPNI